MITDRCKHLYQTKKMLIAFDLHEGIYTLKTVKEEETCKCSYSLQISMTAKITANNLNVQN